MVYETNAITPKHIVIVGRGWGEGVELLLNTLRGSIYERKVGPVRHFEATGREGIQRELNVFIPVEDYFAARTKA